MLDYIEFFHWIKLLVDIILNSLTFETRNVQAAHYSWFWLQLLSNMEHNLLWRMPSISLSWRDDDVLKWGSKRSCLLASTPDKTLTTRGRFIWFCLWTPDNNFMLNEAFDVPSPSFWPAESSLIETDCYYDIFWYLMSNMCRMSNVKVEPIKHNKHSFGFSLSWVVICGQPSAFSDLIIDMKIDEVYALVGVFTTRNKLVFLECCRSWGKCISMLFY